MCLSDQLSHIQTNHLHFENQNQKHFYIKSIKKKKKSALLQLFYILKMNHTARSSSVGYVCVGGEREV